MKKFICVVLSLIMIFSVSSFSAIAEENVTVTYFCEGNIEKVVEGLKAGDTYYPDFYCTKDIKDSQFVGWKNEEGKLVGMDGIVLGVGNNNLFAAYKDTSDITCSALISLNSTNNAHIFLPYLYDNTYYPSINYELNGGFGPKEEITEGEDAPYTRFVSGQYNGRGATLLFDEEGIALTGNWNSNYEITFKYRIPSISSTIHIQPIFGIKKENAQYINSDNIKPNILKTGHTSQLVPRWGYDISHGDNEYRFTADTTADSTQYNIVNGGFSDWRSVTYTIKTDQENSDYLPVFGIYVNVGGGYNSSVVEIKDITLTNKSGSSVEYVVNGKTIDIVKNIETDSTYHIDRVPDNTNTHYFAGWYLDENFENQARSSFVANGKTTLYAKMEEYKNSFSVSSSAETGKGWEAYKHSLRENTWWCYRLVVGAYGIKDGKYGDLIDEGQAHRHYGSEADGNTAIADESGLKHETHDRNNVIWGYHPYSDYILRDENGEAFMAQPNATYKITLTYTFDNSLNPQGVASYNVGIGLSSNALMYSGDMVFSDLGEGSVPYDVLKKYGIDDINDTVFFAESPSVLLTPTSTDKTVSFFITAPSAEKFKQNNLLQVFGISDYVADGCVVKWKSVTVENVDGIELIGNGGVSMLRNMGKWMPQALRYYFTYESVDGNDIVLDGVEYPVISRGVLIQKGIDANTKLKREDADGRCVIDINTTNITECWTLKTLENGNEIIYYSCYIKDIYAEKGDYNSSDRFYARGYVVADIGGQETVLYSSGGSYTVKQVAELQKYHNEGEYKVVNEDGRELVWNLEFNDETDTNELSDRLNTGVETMSPDRKTLFMSAKKDNYFLDSGDLVLRITKNEEKNTYTTASCLTTVDRMAFKYGYVEMRAMVPYRRSVWPSFWMQPDKKLKESTLYNGEIDIFEVFGSPRTAVFNLHKFYNGYEGSDAIGNRGKYTGSLEYKFKNTENLNNEYHIYGFEWTPDYMKVYIDGECYYHVSIKEEDDYSSEHPGMDCFRDYYYLCWNNWLFEEEVTDGSLAAPVDYRIDYVRLYQNPETEYIKIY